MIDSDTPILALDADSRSSQRRRFLQLAGTATVALGLAACGGGNDDSSPTPTPTPSSSGSPTPTPSSTVALDADYLNFALQLQYLSAQYYLRATTGAGIEALPVSTQLPEGGAALVKGTGTQGTVTGGAAVTFTDTLLGEYAREIAAGELAHVLFLRSAVGAAASAQPAIDISDSATGGFTRIARTANLIGVADTFNPYASEVNFLLGAFMLQDVLVTAYRGAIPALSSLLFVNAAADVLATKSFHAAMIRAQLYARGLTVRTQTDQISAARDSFDGSTDSDQGVTGSATAANIVPADVDGIVFGRTPGQVLNVFYANNSAVSGGGFYPSGVTSTFFRTSAAN